MTAPADPAGVCEHGRAFLRDHPEAAEALMPAVAAWHDTGVVSPLHLVAAALGVEPDLEGCVCAVCGGRSLFASAGPVTEVLSSSFAAWEQLPAAAGDMCEGCAACLLGHPSRKPPPLRLFSLAVEAGRLRRLDQHAMWEVLSVPPTDPLVVSWARSHKKHHILNAGISTGGVWRVGSDDGCVEWRHDPALSAAVADLRRAGATKGEIVSGRYRLSTLRRCAETVTGCERVLAPIRGPVLDLLAWACTTEPAADREEDAVMTLPAADRTAAVLLADLVAGAEMRITDGLRFWGGFLLSRLRRFNRLPLPDLMSRLSAEIGASITARRAVARSLDEFTDTDTAAVEAALRTRPDLIEAMAAQIVAGRRDARTEQLASQAPVED